MAAMKRLIPLAVLLALTVLPAQAQAPRDVGEILAREFIYVEPGSEPVNQSELVDLTARMRERGSNYAPVVLADDPSGGADSFASAIVDEFAVGVTVVVLSPSELGFDSTEFSRDELLEAGNASINRFSSDVNDGFTLFADSLVPGVATDTTSGSDFSWALLFIVGAGILVVFILVRRQRKAEKVRKVEDLGEARQEIKHQLDEIANVILAESDAVRVSDHPEAKDYFEAASKTYADALDLFEKSTTLRQLETISEALDRARWQLHASHALREGREVPPEPRRQRATCFFDPAHEPATETAVLRTSAGDRQVKVCPMDARRLRDGERPEPRAINVGGRPVPAPMAPKSYGGGGFGMMDAFEVILGGMAASGGFGGVGRPRPRARQHRRYTRRRETSVSRSSGGWLRKPRKRRAGGASIRRGRGLRRR